MTRLWPGIALHGVLLATATGLVGCSNAAGTGAVIGGIAGAGIGGTIGSFSHARAAEGAVIGGAIGAASGAAIGAALEDQERKDYQKYANWREEDYPVEYQEYRYHTSLPPPRVYSSR